MSSDSYDYSSITIRWESKGQTYRFIAVSRLDNPSGLTKPQYSAGSPGLFDSGRDSLPSNLVRSEMAVYPRHHGYLSSTIMFNLILPAFLGSIVNVSIIHGGSMALSTGYFTEHMIPGHDWWDFPCYSFLVENESLGKKVLFDLGLMKDWREKMPPAILESIKAANVTLTIPKDVSDHLSDANIPLDSIDSIILSHSHTDHLGDPSLYPNTTSLVVGPTFKTNPTLYPGYPLNSKSLIPQVVLEGREVIEVVFNTGLEIGGFPALDFFGDGSFYLLQGPGHTFDHICALARTSEDKFVFMGGDAAHHNGQFRPTELIPLPEFIVPSPFEDHHSQSFCPGSVFESIHPASASGGEYTTMPFYNLSSKTTASMTDGEATLAKLEVFDASADVLLAIAHDISMMEILPFLPAQLNGWEKTDWKELNKWKFLQDFEKALELAGNQTKS